MIDLIILEINSNSIELNISAILFLLFLIVIIMLSYHFYRARKKFYERIDLAINNINAEIGIQEIKTIQPIKEEPFKMIIEKMNYSDVIVNLARNKFNTIVMPKESPEILKVITEIGTIGESAIETNKINFSAISYPYWALLPLIERNVIYPLDPLFNNGDLEKISKIYSSTIELVKKDGKHYGIPFTKISAIMAFKRGLFQNNPKSFEEIFDVLEGKRMNVALYSDNTANSFFYYYFMICGSYGIYPFSTHNGRIVIDFESVESIQALKTFLELCKYAEFDRSDWETPVDSLINKSATAIALIWTEQLSRIINQTDEDIGFCEFPKLSENSFNILDGWFISLINEYDRTANKDIFVKICNLAKLSYFGEVTQYTLSSPYNDNNIRDIQNELRKAVPDHAKGKRLDECAEFINNLFIRSKRLPSNYQSYQSIEIFSNIIADQLPKIKAEGSINYEIIINKINEKLKNRGLL